MVKNILVVGTLISQQRTYFDILTLKNAVFDLCVWAQLCFPHNSNMKIYCVQAKLGFVLTVLLSNYKIIKT